MPPAAQSSIPRLVRTTALLHGIITGKKAPNIKANTIRQTCSTSDMRNCTNKVGAFSFSLWKRYVAQFGGSLLFFPSPCSVQLMVVVIAVAKFGLLQRMWALLIKHEEGWALLYLALPGMCCWTEYAGFQGLESQATRVYNFTMLKVSSTGCLWRMTILGSLNEWYNKLFSNNLSFKNI